MVVRRYVPVRPSAARLTSSLRDIRYDFASAIADLVCDSLSAGASRVEIEIQIAGADSSVLIADSCGMTVKWTGRSATVLDRRVYVHGGQGRYGLESRRLLFQRHTITKADRSPAVITSKSGCSAPFVSLSVRRTWPIPFEILVEGLGRYEEVAGCRYGSQRLSRHLQHG
jgi:hypothetical protein